MIKDNVTETVKAIAEFISARGIQGMLECRDDGSNLNLSREWRIDTGKRSLYVNLNVSHDRGDRFESEDAIYRPLKVRASVTTTGTSMTASDAAAYSSLLLKVAELARDIEREFDAPVYECLVTAEDRTKRNHADMAIAHVQEMGKGMRVGDVRSTKTTLPAGSYPVELGGKKYTVTARAIPSEYNCDVHRTA